MTDQLSNNHIKLLEDRGISGELAAQYGVTSSDKLGGDCISIPYLVGATIVNHKYRTIGDSKLFMQDSDALKCFWNFDAIMDPSLAGQPLVICEGELDALAAIQAGYVRTVSVPDGAPAQAVGENPDSVKYTYLDHAKSALHEIREIILATDGDGPGVNLLNDLALRLGKPRCKWVKYPKGCKDLGDALRTYGERGVKETLLRAQFIKVEGVYRMSDLPPLPQQAVHTIGEPGIDKHYRVRLGDFCVVTGIPSHGKSSWITYVACQMAERYSWVTAFASFEQRPQIDHKRNLRTWHAGKMVRDQSTRETEEADAWIDRQFSFIVPGEDDEVTLAWVLERAAVAIIQHGAKIVVVDPWNEMDHDRPGDMTLTEYTGFAIKQFRKLAAKYQVHVIVAAHPTKQRKDDNGSLQMPTLYDISDSAHWFNKADIGIVVHRLDKTKTIIRVAKSRYHDQIGEPGDIEVAFVPECASYHVISRPDDNV